MVHYRSGAALIMAIVILAALLMLGLPFLFSQSASLSGTRSFAHSQQAQSGRTTAEDLGGCRHLPDAAIVCTERDGGIH
jgi:hypothetical protein